MLFQEKFLIYRAPDAGETATSAVESEVKASPESYDSKAATDLVEAAKAKLPKDMEEGEKKAAISKIESSKARFENLLSAVKKRIELKASLDKLKPEDKNFDFLHAADVIRNAKAEKAKLATVFGAEDAVLASVDTKETAVNNAAEGFYKSLLVPYSGGEKIAEGDAPTSVQFNKYMAHVSKMQEARANGFPGVNEETQKSLKADFDKNISVTMKVLEDYKTKEGISDVDKSSFDRLKFGWDNLTAAEKEGKAEGGHLEGAKAYTQMTLAEQEARRIWTSLPQDANWRNDDITKPEDPEGWNTSGDNYQNYQAAVAAFNEGLKLAKSSKGSGDYAAPMAKFKEAANKWRLVLEAYHETENNKQKEAEKAADEKQRKNMESYNTELDNLATAYGNITSPAVKGYVDEFLLTELPTAKSLAEKGDYVSAKANIKNCVTKINTAFQDFYKMRDAVKGKLDGAISSFAGEGEHKDANKAVRINNWVNDNRALNGMPDYIQKAADTLSFTGWFVYDAWDGPRLYSFNGKRGQIKVAEWDAGSGTGGNYINTPEYQQKYPVGGRSISVDWEKISGKAKFDVTPYKHKDPVKKQETPTPTPAA